MDDSVRGTLEFAAVQLAAVVAGLHLYWAIPRLITAAQTDQPIYWDPRPLLFIVSGVAIIVALLLVRQQLLSRLRAYVLGIGLMLTYILGWAYWHLGGHMAVLPWVEDTHGHSHEGNPIVILAEHLVGSPIDGISKTAETLLLLTLVLLVYAEYAHSSDDAPSVSSTDSSDPEDG
ncbi:hypothetical protein [Natranaeroarchaeum sulfidigenes]|uniref:Putative membrane protein n=1 Tax=Natranaeroarchaeum sulfidigenes TaxID=2784880 RepID=A0A897MWI4_9EURY|nr:hypothetical protein [Natranaeroarchaeum sulfidigenes]QSG04338.1 putative membrane protein [Natranaeroarchaeum sulfidigenes]